MSKPDYMLFSGTSHLKLSEDIAQSLGIKLSQTNIERFPDGEIGVQILENVRGRDVFVIQTIAKEPNLYLMELLILIDALKRASAHRIVAVIPYYGYSRQDRKDKGRVPITAKLVANLLVTAGVSRVITMDLHAEQVQGFFDIPVDNLYARPVLAEGIQRLGAENPVVVTPDIGSIKLARLLANEIHADFAIVDKRRMNATDIKTNAIIGDVQGRDVILVDDICSTGGTLKNAALACKEAGAQRVFAAVTHLLLTKDPMRSFGIEKLLVTDTVPLSKEIDHSHIEVLSVAGLFGKVIDSIVNNQSVSALFRPRT
jgi:ribose-phosphate pyrophosphokinase